MKKIMLIAMTFFISAVSMLQNNEQDTMHASGYLNFMSVASESRTNKILKIEATGLFKSYRNPTLWGDIAEAESSKTLKNFSSEKRVGDASRNLDGLNPPNAPTHYELPVEYIRVENGMELELALSRNKETNFVLADGEYETEAYFKNVCGNSIYAEHLGGALFRSGLSVGGNQCNGGAVIQGLVFRINNPMKTLLNQVITVWGTGRNTKLKDLIIDGYNVVDYGIMVRQAQGVVLQRIVARNFHSGGVQVSTNNRNSVISGIVVMEDIRVEHVARSVPRSSRGTAEACIWVDEPALARRLMMRECAWMGLWTGGNTNGSVFSDVDIDASPNVGVYAEHNTRDTIFERMVIGPNVGIGVNCEWGGHEWGRVGACRNIVIQDSVINSTCGGVGFNPGTRWSTVRRTKFQNQRAFAINDWDGIGNLWDTSGNDYSATSDDAVPIYVGSSRDLVRLKCH